MAKKVGQLEGTEEAEVEKGRHEYDVAAQQGRDAASVDGDGLLTVVPDQFNWRKNVPMKKEQFATEATFIKYQGLVAKQKADFYLEKSNELIGRADRLEKFGSEVARKAANKLVKAKDQIKKLREQLLATGMSEDDLNTLVAGM
jgi:hypothetical protein